MRHCFFIFFILISSTLFQPTYAIAQAKPDLVVGSKLFTENIILGEIISQLLETSGEKIEHKKALGGTQVLWKALLRGDIDAYPEYSGTIEQEILSKIPKEMIPEHLAALGISMTQSLGFNNTYAIGMKKELAKERHLQTISDLRGHADLVLGLTLEFMDRKDGWPGLRKAYGLPHKNVTGLNHDLAYQGLVNDDIQVTDLYTTDAEIAYYDLQILADDQQYFPKYNAVILYRSELKQKVPQAVAMIEGLAGKIPEEKMIAMNGQAKLDRVPEAKVASNFLQQTFNLETNPQIASKWSLLWHYTKAHLYLVCASLFPAILLAIPLGVIAVRVKALSSMILGVVSVIQTLPSLALLTFMIPLFGIGSLPAIAALFLYSLLPIVRNTHAGLMGVAHELKESAEALGLPANTRLFKIELPIALPTIIAGIKTAAVINIGTATLGAFIGAGGFGEPILTGLRLDDKTMVLLLGAIPAAVMALTSLGVFVLIERWVVPKGMRVVAKG